MATRTNPLVSAAVLASTAAIAVATPAIAPFGHLPGPTALQAAKVQLATFADVLSITPAAISDTLFNGWGEAISPNQDLNIDWAAQFVGLNLRCNFSCKVNGPSGIAYMYLDALINGNGAGIENVGGITKIPCGLCNPNKPFDPDPNSKNYNYPYQPDPDKPHYNPYTTPPWGVSAVNYFFEGGPGPGAQYLLSAPFGDPKSPLYNPDIADAINQAFQGALNVTIIYTQALSSIAVLAKQVPVVGPYVYGSIQAYLGYTGYPQGLSGILKYFTDVLANGGANPIPVPVQGRAAAATLAAAATAAPAVTTPAESPSKDVKDDAPAVGVKDDAPAVGVKDDAPAVGVKDDAPAVGANDNTPVVAEDKGSTSAVVDAKDNAPAAKTDDPVVNVPDVEPSTPAADIAPEEPKSSTSDDGLAKEIAKAEKEAAKAEASSSSSAGDVGGSKSDASESKSGGTAASSSASEGNTGATEASAGGTEAKSGGGSDAGSGSDSGDSAK